MNASLIALLAALTGCGGPGPDPLDDEADRLREVGSAVDRESVTAPDTSRGSTEAAEASGARLALDGEGLRIFLVPSGSARLIPFGTPKEQMLTALASVRDGPPREGENVDCGAAYATWEDGLTVWFSRGDFAGWSVPGGHRRLQTASGIGIGSTRAQLDSVYAARVERSTLGVEFAAGGIAGLLESDRPDARITHLWSGVACVAR
jgi:hypothetical protein